MTFIQHIGDLRSRLLKSVIAIVVCSALAAFFTRDVMNWLALPIGTFVFLRPMEAFTVQFKIACYLGFGVSLPYILYQIGTFISDGLTLKEKTYIRYLVPVSYALFMLGGGVALFWVIPNTMRFLMSFETATLQAQLSIESYLDFLGVMCLAFGFLFQIPLVMHCMARLGIIQADFLAQKRKTAYVLLVIFAALLNPVPEMIAHLLVSGVAILLYEISIFLIKWETGRNKKQKKIEKSDIQESRLDV